MPANENGCEVAVTDHTRLWLGDGRSLARLAGPIQAYLPWAREAPLQNVHSISRFLGLSNNLRNPLFARRTTPIAVSDWVLIRF
jgi:hypothetical protein